MKAIDKTQNDDSNFFGEADRGDTLSHASASETGALHDFWWTLLKKTGRMSLDDTLLTQQLWDMRLLIATALPDVLWLITSTDELYLLSSPPVSESWQPHYSSVVRQNVIECE